MKRLKTAMIGAVQRLRTYRVYTRWIDASRAVNMSTLELDCMVTGRAFQRRTVVGKEELQWY
jgi:hypothetical protein